MIIKVVYSEEGKYFKIVNQNRRYFTLELKSEKYCRK